MTSLVKGHGLEQLIAGVITQGEFLLKICVIERSEAKFCQITSKVGLQVFEIVTQTVLVFRPDLDFADQEFLDPTKTSLVVVVMIETSSAYEADLKGVVAAVGRCSVADIFGVELLIHSFVAVVDGHAFKSAPGFEIPSKGFAVRGIVITAAFACSE